MNMFINFCELFYSTERGCGEVQKGKIILFKKLALLQSQLRAVRYLEDVVSPLKKNRYLKADCDLSDQRRAAINVSLVKHIKVTWPCSFNHPWKAVMLA